MKSLMHFSKIATLLPTMGQTKRLIDSSEVVRHTDGRIDLFSTILARKDPTAQVPVLADTTSNTSTTSASQPAPGSRDASLRHQVPSSSSLDSRPKRRWSKSPSPPLDKDSAAENTSKIIKADPGSAVTSSHSWSDNSPASVGRKSWGGLPFQKIFIGYCAQPSTIPPEIAYWHDDKHVILKDCYPKAKAHLLVLPRQDINKVTDLSGAEGILTVERLVERANWLLDRLKVESPALEFRMGFHAVPSLLRLHLHVISQDFSSEALKTKRHWNSFTTPFFIPPQEVITTIKSKGSFAMTPQQLAEYEALLKRDLQCNQCGEKPKNMVVLKDHLKEHFLLKAERAESKSRNSKA